jgi:hypothetical protein
VMKDKILIAYDGVNWIQIVKSRLQLRAFLKHGAQLLYSIISTGFLENLSTIKFLKQSTN